MRVLTWTCLLIVAFALSILSASAKSSIAPIHNAISGYIIPNMERFAELSDLLSEEMETLCVESSADQLEVVQAAFRGAVLAFARIEFLRFGPLALNNHQERLLFWPDRRSIGLKQVQRALASRDENVLDLSKLAKKSVALQGFGTLEFLLFGSGNIELTKTANSFRCVFSHAVSLNIAAISRSLSKEWNAEDGFVAGWSNPAANNDRFRSNEEAQSVIIGAVANGLEVVKDQQLKPIAPIGADYKSYKKALFWRSNLTRDFMTSTLLGLRDFTTISGILGELPKERHWIGGAVAFEFKNALTTLSVLEGAVSEMISSPEKAPQLSYLIVVTRSLQTLIGEQAARALDLPSTFSPLDGD